MKGRSVSMELVYKKQHYLSTSFISFRDMDIECSTAATNSSGGNEFSNTSLFLLLVVVLAVLHYMPMSQAYERVRRIMLFLIHFLPPSSHSFLP